ncbi:uncharacterized protein At4g22758-like [Telopea speciosissima]|uniref:uncharacterized protein At4g22758-like n=1 Tax=Telopea speciosissima TaxID=54955 RepID=UPI001CC5E2AB|nr:uncharacterized protein At4g22758-like [Telopea speciosissima]
MAARLTKLLLNVMIQRSLGAVKVVMSPESTVGDLIAAAVRLYAKEGRRPLLPMTDPADFDLHYSQFSLESLNREEKLKELGSRNFFLCRKKPNEAPVDASSSSSSSSLAVASSSCSNQAEKVSKIAVPWVRFMNFLLKLIESEREREREKTLSKIRAGPDGGCCVAHGSVKIMSRELLLIL